MLSEFEYLILLLIIGLPTIAFTFHPRVYMGRNWRFATISIPLVAIPWLIWDVWATDRAHWAFNSDYYLGIKIFNLPFEEVLFFLIVPYSMVFLWVSIKRFTTWKDFWQRLLG